MPIYTIAFESRNPAMRHDYGPLQQELAAQRCAPLLSNQWLGSFNNSAQQVHDHFRKLLAADDRLIVAELFQHFAYSRVAAAAHQWLQNNPPAELPGVPPGIPAKQPAAAAAATKQPAAAKTSAKQPPAKQPAAKKAPAKKAPAKKAASKA